MFQTINYQATFHQASIPKTSSKSDSGFIFFHGLVVFCMVQPIHAINTADIVMKKSAIMKLKCFAADDPSQVVMA